MSRQSDLPRLERDALNTKRLAPVHQFFDWAVDHDYIATNPAAGVRLEVPKGARARKKRDGFSVDQLNTLFRAPVFTGVKSDWKWKEAGDQLVRDERFWVPILALFSGGRRSELCQLMVTDVFERDGVWAMSINDAEDEQPESSKVAKHTKTAGSNRSVPFHSQLLSLGFVDYVAARKSSGHKKVFDADPGKVGNYDPFGKWFGRLLDSQGLTSKRLVLHSMRHNFEQAMLENDVEMVARHQLTGRVRSGSAALYQQGHGLRRLLTEIDKVKYPGLDLSHLKRFTP